MTIQLEGNLKLGPAGMALTDFSENITRFKIVTKRNQVTKKPNLKDARGSAAAGTMEEMLEIQFDDGVQAAGIWATLYEVIHTPSAEFDFEGTMEPGAVGPNNRKWSGRATLLTLDTGNDVGSDREQTISCPITRAGLSWVIA